MPDTIIGIYVVVQSPIRVQLSETPWTSFNGVGQKVSLSFAAGS